jgi:hypothetical protein
VDIREEAGLLPHTEVEFELDDKGVRVRRPKAARASGRGTNCSPGTPPGIGPASRG